jgi:ABC-2 type transport system ATP-binding protein
MPRAVTTVGLTKCFGATTAVEGITLEVAAGEVFGLVGPNGAGKTTLLQLLAALLNPTSGNAAVLGYDVRRDADALRQHIGYVSQEFTLYGTLSVEENLDFFADLYGVPAKIREQRKTALLAWSRLAPFRQRRAARLSGGMQKKLHLCCTLIHEPDLLLLDEPTTGVDPVSRQELWENLYDLVGPVAPAQRSSGTRSIQWRGSSGPGPCSRCSIGSSMPRSPSSGIAVATISISWPLMRSTYPPRYGVC